MTRAARSEHNAENLSSAQEPVEPTPDEPDPEPEPEAEPETEPETKTKTKPAT